MAKVKKELKVVNSPTQKINRKPLKKKVIQKKAKEIKKKIITIDKIITKQIDQSNDKENFTNAPINKALNYDKLNIDLDQVEKGVEALLQYTEKYKSKDLFKGQQQIFVQLTAVRIPTGANRKFRIKLQHPLITISNEICLIVPDLKRGRKVDHEETIEHYENLLKSKNVTFIKRIIPIRQLRVEYDQFELKRRLCGYYDYILVDGRISGHVLHLLGKTFNEKRKQPVPVQLTSENLNNALLKAMSKTELHIHSKGDSYIVQIGHTDMPVEHIVDNLKVIVNSIVTNFPGSWQNIRSLHVKTEKSIAIPVYYSLKNANEVVPPKIKVPKSNEAVTDELTTRKHTVTVHPDGRVILNHPKAMSNNKIKVIENSKIKSKKSALAMNKNDKFKKNKSKKNLLKSARGKNSPIKIKAKINGTVKKIKTDVNGKVKKIKGEVNGKVKKNKSQSDDKVKNESASTVEKNKKESRTTKKNKTEK